MTPSWRSPWRPPPRWKKRPLPNRRRPPDAGALVAPEPEPELPAQQQGLPEESLDEEQMLVDLSEPEPEDFSAPDEWSKVSPIRPQLHDEMEVEESIGHRHLRDHRARRRQLSCRPRNMSTRRNWTRSCSRSPARSSGDELAQVREDLATLQNLQVEELPTEDVVLESPQEARARCDAAVGNRRGCTGPGRRAPPRCWLLLLGQVVHHHRQALVAQAWAEAPLALDLRTVRRDAGAAMGPDGL